jgi:molybdopterin/thiamine biosynthesis adenylyltransferase
MSNFSVVLTEEVDLTLRAELFAQSGIEGAAYVLFREAHIGLDPWDRRSHLKLLAREVIPIAQNNRVSASGMHVTWDTRGFVCLLKRAREEGLIVGIAHCHPNGPLEFSDQDTENESDLLRTACNRNGTEAKLVSLLFDGDGQVRARVWEYPKHVTIARSVSILGERFQFYLADQDRPPSAVFARQALAFGPGLTTILRSMRVGIVGNGATGSATALMAARMGVGQIALFDDDIVDVTNLNRLHGATQSDADSMRAKADVIAGEIARMGVGTRAIPIRGWVNSPNARDALKSCDVVFCCTDDHSGRLFLNRLAYFYLIPVIDMGLAMAVATMLGRGMADISARVTVVMPPEACLMCRRVVDPDRARAEDLRRENPTEYDRQKREAYVIGEGNPSPAVVTFTTETACIALNELLNRLTGFRRKNMGSEFRRRFLFSEDRPTGAIRKTSCPVCGSSAVWGMGDVDPFLVG